MTGITILNTFTELQGSIFLGIFFASLGLILMICAIIIIIIMISEQSLDEWPVVLLAIIMSLFLLPAGIKEFKNKDNFKTYYQVIVDDNVSFTEFTEKYNIIKQEGQIYTVIEREKEE